MQLSIETTTTSTSVMTATFNGNGQLGRAADEKAGDAKAPAVSLLQAAAEKAEDDAAVIAVLRQAVEERRGEDEEKAEETGLATIEDYQKTAGRLADALGEDIGGPGAVSYESATISTTSIEAEIGGQTISAEFVSFERVSFDSATGLSVRSANASTIDADFGNGHTASHQSASVSSLYAGTGSQLGNLIEGLA